VRLTCTDCPKRFRTPTGLDWHRQHIHGTTPYAEEGNEADDFSIPVDTSRGTEQRPTNPITIAWNFTTGRYEVEGTQRPINPITLAWNPTTTRYEVERPSRQIQQANPPPTTPGDYNCLDCPVGGFYLSAALGHYRQTGHRLGLIPGTTRPGVRF